MNRRAFLRFALPAVAGIALDRAVPLGRVWSFPSTIRIANAAQVDDEWLALQRLQRDEIAAIFRVPPHYLPTIRACAEEHDRDNLRRSASIIRGW